MGAIAAYLRISKDREGRSEGVAVQERRCRQYAGEHWPDSPIRVFSDNDISAAGNAERPGYNNLIDAIRRGEIEQIVTAEQSRLVRKPIELEGLLVTLSTAGIDRVHCYRDSDIDVRSKMVARIKGAVNAEEIERTRIRILDRLGALAAEGRPTGTAKFGYRNSVDSAGRKALEVVPEEVEIVRWMADSILAGWSLTNIAKTLTAKGVPTRRGGKWATPTVKTILMSPTIVGHRVHRGQDVGRATWEPILDEATWRQVCAVLSGPAVVQRSDGKGTYPVSRRRRAPRKYLLTGGLAVCGRCGAPLVAQRRYEPRGQRPSYLCMSLRGGCNGLGILAEAFENYVAEKFLAELNRPAFLRALTEGDRAADSRKKLTVELGDVAERQAELARRWGGGEIDSGTWDAARGALEERKAALEAQLASLPSGGIQVDPQMIQAGWALMTLEEKRTVLARFVEKVTVLPAKPGTRKFDSARVAITWKVRRSSGRHLRAV